jgi:hypothetical protein
MKKLLILFFLGCYSLLYGQNRIILQQSYFKEKFISLSKNKSIETFFPANTNQLNIAQLNRDSIPVYTDVEAYLYKRFPIELKKNGISIGITPLLNYSKGRVGKLDSNYWPVYRNTRGIYVEGDLLSKVGFNFSFCENQAQFQDYENIYFNQQGENYVKFYGQYSTQNAMIPGASRTKPFKATGYDYAYSSGNIHVNFHPKFQIEFGNNQHFIGSGYRSLLLSDNSSNSPSLRIKWKINRFINYQVLYRKQLNLYRKPTTLAVESNFENKLFAASYLTFQPIDALSISLFTGGNQLRGDSISMHKLIPSQLIPLPLLQNDILLENQSIINGITGVNIDFALNKIRIYGQLVADKYNDTWLGAGQIGLYYFDAFGVKNFQVQCEWNQVPKNFYGASRAKLSYSNYNLPSAHPKGNNFSELFVKLGYQFNRFYLNSKTNIYYTQGGNLTQQFLSNSIFAPKLDPSDLKNGTTILENIEVGFRFNNLYNGTLFVNYQGRASSFDHLESSYQCLMLGLRTSITNEYFDF